MTIYLDCNATTPIEAQVQNSIIKYMTEEFGNAASRTHEYGLTAKKAVQLARDQIAQLVNAKREEVIFTSGATESNNIAILGLQKYGIQHNKRHIISTKIEHKAVLEPLMELEKQGFEISLIPPNKHGYVEPQAIKNALRKDTLLVSIMHANNETGILQPITKIAEQLQEHKAYFHVDAAQAYGKDIPTLRNQRIDMISASAHKIYGPKGIGTLIIRRRGYEKIPLTPLMYGGGQERGLKPGTLPVPLIVGFGIASQLALKNHKQRNQSCKQFKQKLITALTPLNPTIHGNLQHSLANCINFSIKGIDSEAAILALKGIIAISNGSACTSSNYSSSHVLQAMQLSEPQIQGALRISWCHLTPSINWQPIIEHLNQLIT